MTAPSLETQEGSTGGTQPLEQRRNFRPDVQGLRAIAVLLVILCHAAFPGFEGGYVGVDVFFVISGFVITGLLQRQPPRQLGTNLANFYARRIRRIVPAATLVLVVTVVAAQALLGRNFNPELFGDVRWSALFGANFRLINTGSNYFIPGLAPSLVTHYWSLAVEEQFYLVFPLIVFSLTSFTPLRYRTSSLARFLVVAVSASAWWSFHLTTVNPVAAYYSPFTRFWELALGGLVALAPAAWARRTPRLNTVVAVAAMVVLAVVATRFNAQTPFPGVLAWWPCGAAAVLLYTGRSTLAGAPATWLSWRPLGYVGDLSYSLYLWHYPWLMLPAQMVHPLTSAFDRAIEIVGAFVCAAISYHFIENPIRYSKRLGHDRLAVALVLVVCLAASIDATIIVAHYAHVAT